MSIATSNVSSVQTSYKKVLILAVLVFGLVLRLILAYAFQGNSDQQSYETVAQIMQQGGNVYAETAKYNYSPFWSLWLLACSLLANTVGLPFHFILRTSLSLIDIADAALIGAIAERSQPGSFRLAFAAYFLNPVAIVIVGYQGMFENLAALPLLAAIYLLTARPDVPHRCIWLLSWLALVIKHIMLFPVMALYACVTRSRLRALLWTFLAGLAFLTTFTPYIREGWNGILRNVFLYQSIGGEFGMGRLFPPMLAAVPFYLLMPYLSITLPLKQNWAPVAALETATILFLILTHGLGAQYFILPVLFGSIRRTRGFWIYSAIAGLFIVSAYLIGSSAWMFINAVWLACLAWLMDSLIAHTRATIINS